MMPLRLRSPAKRSAAKVTQIRNTYCLGPEPRGVGQPGGVGRLRGVGRFGGGQDAYGHPSVGVLGCSPLLEKNFYPNLGSLVHCTRTERVHRVRLCVR